jgi:hypothetical protein
MQPERKGGKYALSAERQTDLPALDYEAEAPKQPELDL